MSRQSLTVALLLPLLTLACAPNSPATSLSATTPVSPAAQQATPVSMPETTASGPACLANPNYARKPVEGRSGSRVEWVAKADGIGCQWQRTRA